MKGFVHWFKYSSEYQSRPAYQPVTIFRLSINIKLANVHALCHFIFFTCAFYSYSSMFSKKPFFLVIYLLKAFSPNPHHALHALPKRDLHIRLGHTQIAKNRIHNRFTSPIRFTNNQILIFACPSLERTHATSCTNSIAFDHRSIGANLNLILYF